MIIVIIMMIMVIMTIVTIMKTIVIALMILMVNFYVVYYKSDQVCHENSGNHYDHGDNENSDNHDDHCNRNDDLVGQLLCDLLQVRSGLSCAINKMRFVIYFYAAFN